MDLQLRGRTAVVTGASKGIGRAIAAALAAEGMNLVLTARSADLLEQAAGELSARHEVDVRSFTGDLSSAEAVGQLAEFAAADGRAIDVLVNNAGAIPSGPLAALEDDAWLRSYDLKLWGYVRAARAFLPAMRARRRGVILNIIGGAGRRPSAGYIAGAVANAGLMNFTTALAQDAGPEGVRAVGINPGLTRTERMDVMLARQASAGGVTPAEAATRAARDIPLRRVGEPEDIGYLAAFLVSDRASFITGCVIPVDGGSAGLP